jgi:hypothetical protein
MHTSTFATRHINSGWVIDATKANGQVVQLMGVYVEEKAAKAWIAEHPAEWFKLNQN